MTGQKISTKKVLPRHLKLESNGLQVDSSHKFSERNFSTPTIFKATSKLFDSLGCSDDKN